MKKKHGFSNDLCKSALSLYEKKLGKACLDSIITKELI